MSAPLVINLKDGSVWERRAVTGEGVALYALAGSCKCPEFVMATESELAALGIAGSADVLPVPVGPMPQGLSVEREREIRSLDLLALMSDRAAPVVSGHLAVLLAEIDRLRAERHTTNEALSDAAVALRAKEQSAGSYPPALPWAALMDDGDLHEFLGDLVSAAMGRWRSGPEVPDRVVLADIEKVCADWRTPGEGLRGDEPEATDAVTQVFAPVVSLREPEGEFHQFLHHENRTPHDLPQAGGAG